MILTPPDDRSFPNGPAYEKGDRVDVSVLAEAIGHPDPAALAVDLAEQGWTEAKTPKRPAASKKAAANTTNPPDGDNPKEP